MIPEKYQQVGNILMVYNPDGFIPKTIRKVMLMKGIRKGYTIPDRIYNHAEIFVETGNRLGSQIGLCSAIKKGAVIRFPSEVCLPMTKKKFAVLEPKTPYLDWEKIKISDKAYDMVRNPHRYDFLSLGIWHIIAAFTDEWIGKKDKKAEKRLYCYEVASNCSNASDRIMFEHDHYTDFWHIWLNDNYKLAWESK